MAGWEISRVIDELIQWRTLHAAQFEEIDEILGLKDFLESLYAQVKDWISEVVEEGNFERAAARTVVVTKVLQEMEVPDQIKDAVYEYILYMEEHPDGDGVTVFLDSACLSFNESRSDFDTAFRCRQLEFEAFNYDVVMSAVHFAFEATKGKLEFTAFNNELVKRAVDFAIEATKGKKLLDGTFVIDRLICTAILLAGSSNSEAVVTSGLLLHDSLYDAKAQYNALENKFGIEVADLVRDVSKLSKLSEISREKELENPNYMPDLILAMVADARAIMIKIAEHIVQMLTLDTMNSEKKQRFVNETSHMHIPLAERLGLNLWKNQLENLCVSASDELETLYASVSEYDVDGIAFEAKLRDALKEEILTDFHVESRKKSLCSILKKLHKYHLSEQEKNKTFGKNINFSNIRDIIGLRIIVENVEECYKAKDVVEKLWNADPEFEKDYIKNPKDGYRSLHVSVKNAKDQYMEVQIRTNEMHMASDDSHWLYKEGDLQVSEYIKELVKFARLVYQKEAKVTGVEGNSSPHQPACSYAKLNKPPCLDATGICRFPRKGPVYVIVKAKNKVTIEQHPAGTLLGALCKERGCEGRVLVNEEDADLDYVLIVGDIIKFV